MKARKTKKGANKTLVNGYSIRYNPMYKKYVVSHPEIGAGLALFKLKKDAVVYCKKG